MKKHNPKVDVGDRIQILHMEDETSVPPLTKGTVVSIQQDPFEDEGQYIIKVNWDNGSSLQLLTSVDVYRLIEKTLKEQESSSGDALHDYMRGNSNIFKNFDRKFFRDYLLKVRDSGVINMFGSSQFLWMGRESIDRYYGEGQEDNEIFQEVLDMADDAKFKLIQGTIKKLESENKPIDLNTVKRSAESNAVKLLQMYIVTFD